MKKQTIITLALLTVAAIIAGCQHPKSKMRETRNVQFATDESGTGTGSVVTTNREILPDGRTNEVTVALTNATSYAETAESKSGSLAFLSKQQAAAVTTDRRTSMGGRLKTGLTDYAGEVQPDAISAIAQPISDTLKAYLATVSGGATAAAEAITAGNATPEDYDAVPEDLDARRAEVKKLKKQAATEEE